MHLNLFAIDFFYMFSITVSLQMRSILLDNQGVVRIMYFRIMLTKNLGKYQAAC